MSNPTYEDVKAKLHDCLSQTLAEREEIAQLHARIREIESRVGERVLKARRVISSMGASRVTDLLPAQYAGLIEKLDAEFKQD